MTLKICLLALFIAVIFSATCKGKPNPYPTADANFQKVGSHQFGDKYHYYNADVDHHYFLLKLWGNSYQAGFAYGTLMRNQIKDSINLLWKYYYELAEEEFAFITKVPAKLQPLARSLAVKLMKSLLIANHYVTKPYTPKRFLDEYAGISAGSGVDMKLIIEVNMIPEYTRAGCSILGAWGNATKNGDLIHLRALDWDVNNPMNKYPLIVVYNLTEKGSKPFVNVGWTGFVGSITGFSETIGVGEKVRKQNPVKQNETRLGKPWTYAIRDTLQFTDNIDSALQSFNQTKRTCSIHLGLSSVKNNTFRVIEYSHKQFIVYTDKNYPYAPYHQQFDDIVFVTVHQPQTTCFNDLIKQKYGEIDQQWMTNILSAQHQTGDTHMVAYNFNKKELLFQVSYNKKQAYKRPTLRIKLAEYFKH